MAHEASRWKCPLAATLIALSACSGDTPPQPPATPLTPPPPQVEPPAPAVIRREIRVRVACDEEFRATPDWEIVARRRMVQASGVYERRFAIAWKVIDVVQWTSDDSATSLGKLVNQAERDVSREGVDVVVGFTGQTRAKGADRDYAMVGNADYFGPVAVVSSQTRATSEEEYVGTLAHELGHMLGMWHCEDPRFVMHAGSHAFPLEFDPQSAAVVVVTREIDFAKGGAWIDDGKRRRLDGIFRWGHAPDALLPYVKVELGDAWRLVHEEDDVEAGRAAYRRALADQRRCMGRADSTLIPCLCRLAWAELRDPGKDVKAAKRLATRAQKIVRATGCRSDPPLDEEWVLADVAWARGRREDSIVALRRVYEARLKALGASNGDTADVKDVLDSRVRKMQPLIAPVGTK